MTRDRRYRTAAALAACLLLAACARPAKVPARARAPRPAGRAPVTSSVASANAIVPSYVHMVTAQNGWGVGAGIFLTRDGGRRWADVTPPGATATWPEFPDQISIPNASTAWVVGQLAQGEALYRTTTAGGSWQNVRLPAVNVRIDGLYFTSYTGVSIAATSAQDAWLLAILAQAAGTEYAELYQTTDGGQIWEAQGSWVGGDSTVLVAQTSTSLWLGVYGAETTNSASVSHSADGGERWQDVRLPVPGAYQQNFFGTLGPQFFNAEDGLIPVLPGVSPAVLIFDSTVDGGQSWQASTPLVVHTLKQVYAFADAEHGWVATGQQVVATTDGGQSWHALTPTGNAPVPQDIQQLDFVSPSTGWAVAVSGGKAQLWRTQDGGAAWTELGSTS